MGLLTYILTTHLQEENHYLCPVYFYIIKVHPNHKGGGSKRKAVFSFLDINPAHIRASAVLLSLDNVC